MSRRMLPCYDCHGHHDVLPPSNPESKLLAQNIFATCQQCHPTATAKFTDYKPHVNPLETKNYPALHWAFVFMTSLLVAVFVFFSAHTVAWLTRVGYLYWHNSNKFREAKVSRQSGGQWLTRFVRLNASCISLSSQAFRCLSSQEYL